MREKKTDPSAESALIRKWGSGFKIKEHRFRLGIRKLFTVRVVRHWNRLPRDVVDAPSLETFRVK